MDRLTTLDRILSVEPGKGAKAVRNVPQTLAIFQTHFPRFPVLPGVLILGSLGRLGTTLLEAQTGRPWRLVAVEQVRFRHYAQPGDRLDLSVEVGEASDEAATLTGSVSVDDRVIATARRLKFVPQLS